MKYCICIICLFFVFTTGIYAQDTHDLDGREYVVIEPYIYQFNADNRTLKVGERYVMDAIMWQVKGNSLFLSEISVLNSFRLLEPLRHETGVFLPVTVFLEIEDVNSIGTDAKVIKLIRRN